MITFAEYRLVESFDIGTKPIRSSKEGMRDILIKYLYPKYKETASVVADNILNNYRESLIFDIAVMGNDYILMLMRNNEDYCEMHFNRMDKIDDFSDLNDMRNPIRVFAELFRYAYWFVISKNKKLQLVAGDIERLGFYNRLLMSLSKKGLIEKDKIKTNELTILIESINQFDLFVEKFSP